jgi:hypothetical protein
VLKDAGSGREEGANPHEEETEVYRAQEKAVKFPTDEKTRRDRRHEPGEG